jgi:hypothetical protein
MSTDEPVLLVGRCPRKGHEMFRVQSADGLVIDARRRALGRERTTWTPMRRPLEEGGRIERYGCACGRSALLADRNVRPHPAWRDRLGHCRH